VNKNQTLSGLFLLVGGNLGVLKKFIRTAALFLCFQLWALWPLSALAFENPALPLRCSCSTSFPPSGSNLHLNSAAAHRRAQEHELKRVGTAR
jgi:hypothetical protein